MRHCAQVVVLLAGIAPGAGAQMTTSLLAQVDGEVQYSGVLGYTVLEDNTTVRTSRSGGNNVRHSVYEFDFGSLPAGAIITSATLKLTTGGILSNTGTAADVFFYAFEGDGLITESDHGNITPGIEVAAQTYLTGSNGPSIGTLLQIPLNDLSALQSVADGGGSFLSIRSQTVNFVTFTIRSLETGVSGTVRPTLEVTYIPAPASLGLLVMAGLYARRRP